MNEWYLFYVFGGILAGILLWTLREIHDTIKLKLKIDTLFACETRQRIADKDPNKICYKCLEEDGEVEVCKIMNG